MRKNLLLVLLLTLPQIAHSAAPKADEEKRLLSSSRAVVSKGDFDAFMQKLPEQDRVLFLQDGKRINTVLENIYVNRALSNEARKLKLDADPLVKHQLRIQEEQFLAKLRLDRLQRDTVAPDFEARALEKYKVEAERFTVPPQVHAMHILVSAKARNKDEALQRAREIHGKVLAQEKPFEELALEYSDDPSAKSNRGDLGFFAAATMVKPFADAAFALAEPGQVSEPVETSFGFHIIKLIEKKAGFKKPYDSVKADIVKGLQFEYFENAKREYLNAIKADKGIISDSEAILGLQPKVIKPTDLPGAAEKKP